MQERFKILYFFESDKQSLLEIKVLNDFLSREEKYHWLLFHRGESAPVRLLFRGMDDGMRKFEQGKFLFDSENGSLSIGTNLYKMKNRSNCKPDVPLMDRCKAFLRLRE